ncbi:hypothetical protein A3D78_01140 [Candidatus Gottesmanbacteria bacterium RIFCSPHIGHO2_02_FULL_39_14]|uniref:Glycosyl transferase CAP10 domain-containing protein n=1 Tax=Candidatus Gottesmanbacteria bacterium RIFCSPHIGHO2_02_FULL_39_14 TaxID=1798383 RepID=A0A1F6A0F7_9BACT|nr:MAG: hypothetical protein A3D78_01140 [Candidatus Gottesmanbacteria bacterium RIFCSPHIGHO2_02_FULL_39_14]
MKYKVAYIVKNWSYPDLLRQTSGNLGIWKNVRFTLKPVKECDYLIVLNYSPLTIKVKCPPENIWLVAQEPPYPIFRDLKFIPKIYSRVFTVDRAFKEEKYEYSQPALPWHINKSYDELNSMPVPKKKFTLSCITSLKKNVRGHVTRLELLKKLKKNLRFDFIATTDIYTIGNKSESPNKLRERLLKLGYTKIVRGGKWEGLSPYRYSIVIENYHGLDNWTEKLADCFLSYTMPIYSGCTNISHYFPKDSLFTFDLDDPDIYKKINRLISSDHWLKNLNSIKKARQLILEKYQFFPYFAQKINSAEKKNTVKKIKKEIVLYRENKFSDHLLHKVRRLFG